MTFQSYDDAELFPIERCDAAILAHEAQSPELKEKVREAQWQMVDRGEADMDAAFIIAVEKLVK